MARTIRPRFQVRCLGEPALLTLGGRSVRIRTRKELALLCYLAVERQWHTRDVLADLLWPDRGHKESRHSLAVALSALRGKLGREILETEHDRVRVRPEGVAVDIDRLLAGDIVGSDTEVPLDVDGFLEGFEIPGAVTFAHWRDGERARLLPHVLDALVILLDRCRRRGDFRQIETLALRLQRFEPLSEHAMRARMEARAFSGDRLTALRLFEAWKAELAEQLQAVPSDLVEGMALRLRRRGWERPGSADIPTVHTDQWKDRPFVGRALEYRELYEAWESVQRCEPAHRLVLGDSGIGKSTLVERVSTAAGLEGATVARVQCHEAEREIPYATISGLIAQLADRPGASATPPEALAELAQTIPEVRRRFPVLPPPLETHGDASRIRFTEATHALIAALAEEHPVLLVVDDVHHSDDVSLAVLHRVIRLSERQALLVFFLARPGELHQSPQASRLRDHGMTLGIQQLLVGPLSREESLEFLEHILRDLGLAAAPLVRRTLLSAAGGFPLVLELLLKDWAHSGDHSLAMALDAVTADVTPPSEPHHAYRLLVERLLTQLEPTARTVLDVAAVLGPRASDTSLYAVADLKVSEVLTGMSRLEELHLLRDSGRQVEFANDLVRGIAYLRIPPPLRHTLHSLVADVLAMRARQGDDTVDFEIAWHSMRCGRTADATNHLLRGSRSAIRRGAVHEGEQRLTSAIGSLSGASRTEATLLLAELLQEQGRFTESVALLDGEPSAAKSLQGNALKRLGGLHMDETSPSVSVSTWEWVAALLLNPDLGRETARIALGLAAELAYTARDTGLALQIQQVLAASPIRDWSGDDAIELGTQAAYIGHYASRHNLHAATEQTLARLLAILEQVGPDPSVNSRSVRLFSGVGLMHKSLGRYDDAMPFLRKALELAWRLEHPGRIANTCVHLASCAMETGDHLSQLQFAERALTQPFLNGTTQLALYHGAVSSALLGNIQGAAKRADDLIGQRATTDREQQLQMLRAADAYWLLGRSKQARRLALEGVTLGNGSPLGAAAVGLHYRWLGDLVQDARDPMLRAWCSAAIDTEAEAVDLWDRAEATAGRLMAAGVLGQPVDRLRVELDITLGALHPAAQEHLRRFQLA